MVLLQLLSKQNKPRKRTTERRSDNFIAENRNKNTTKKTQSDLNVFYRWAKTVNETRTIENIRPEQELDKVLAHFFLNVRKTNGDEYEPDTLTSMLRSFEKHYSILTDRQFTKVREALSSKRKQLRMSSKLSSFIEVCDARNKSVAESKILTPRANPQRDESEGKHLFTGAVFNNCQFTF